MSKKEYRQYHTERCLNVLELKHKEAMDALERAWEYIRGARLTGNIPWENDVMFVAHVLGKQTQKMRDRYKRFFGKEWRKDCEGD